MTYDLPAGFTLEERTPPTRGEWIAPYAIRDASGAIVVARRTPRECVEAICRHCGALFISQLGADTAAGRHCAACYQYENLPVAECHCGARLIVAREKNGPVRFACDHCRALERQPQGQSVRLFEPAPEVMPGQLGFGTA